jgi:hydroxypyruvate isomerase
MADMRPMSASLKQRGGVATFAVRTGAAAQPTPPNASTMNAHFVMFHLPVFQEGPTEIFSEGFARQGRFLRMPRFSANLGFLFNEVGFLDRFAAAAAAGFKGVEFSDPYSHPVEDLRSRLVGLDCVLLNLPMGDRSRGDMGIACLPERIEEFRAGVPRAVEIARTLGCQRLNCIAGLAPPDADRARLRATLARNLAFAARALAPEGMTLLLEPINSIDWPGFFVDGCQQALEIIAEVGAPNLRLQLDAYHHFMSTRRPPPLEGLLPFVGHVQFAGAPGRHEPGTGELDCAALFAELDRLGYSGWVGAEYRPTRRTEETLGWLAQPSLTARGPR